MGRPIVIQSLLSGLRDASGRTLSGGKVYAYEPGSTVERAIYSDINKSQVITQPLVLSSQGTAQVYADGVYRLLVTTSADAQIYDWDNVPLVSSDSLTEWGGTSTGGANTYNVSIAPGVSAYEAGRTVRFRAHQSNTSTSPTLNVNGLGAIAIKDATGAALYVGAITANRCYQATYCTSPSVFLLNENPNTTLTPQMFGAKGDGINDDTAAIQAAIDGTSGGVVYLPAGTYKVTNTLVISSASIWLEGAGIRVTNISFVPSSNGLAVIRATNSIGGVANLKIFTTNTTWQKIGIDIITCDTFKIEGVQIGADGTWTGNNGNASTPSIALRLGGHELNYITNCTLCGDLPIQFAGSCDHFHLHNLYLIAGNTNYCIEAIDGITLANLTIDGAQAWVKGIGGFKWDSTTATSQQIVIRNVRYEQPVGTNGWLIYFSNISAGALHSVTLDNFWGGLNINGIYLKGVRYATLTNVAALTINDRVALQLDTVESVNVVNCGFTTAITLAANVKEAIAYGRTTLDNGMKTATYERAQGSVLDGLRLQGNTYYGLSGTALGSGASTTLPTASTLQYIMFISAAKTDQSAYCAGLIAVCGSAITLLSGTANFRTTDVAGNFCVLGGSNLTIKNYLADMKYTATMIGAAYG